jgi:small subunit ribosomal protein S18
MPPPSRKRPPSKTADQRNRQGRGKPKVCVFCADHAVWVDYKDTNVLRRFISDRGKIRSRGNTGTCAQHQREVAVAIKTARELALLPYAVRTLAADKPGGRGRGSGPRGGPRPSADDAAPRAAEEPVRATDEAAPDGAEADAVVEAV